MWTSFLGAYALASCMLTFLHSCVLLTSPVHVRHHAIRGFEADSIPFCVCHARNRDDERRLCARVQRRRLNGGASARHEPSLVIEEKNDGRQLSEFLSARRIAKHAAHREAVGVAFV